MTADLGFNPQVNQSAQTPATQSEPREREDAAIVQERKTEKNPHLARAADVAELSRQAVMRQAESGSITPEMRSDINALSEMQNNLDEVEQKVRSIRDEENLAAEGKRTNEELVSSQQQIDRNLNEINQSGENIQQQTAQLQTSPAPISGRLQIVVDTEDLGRLEIVPGESVSMADLKTGGNASVNNDPKLAAQVAEKALEEISTMRTEVANVASAATSSYFSGSEGNLITSNNAMAVAQQIVGNSLNNPGALLEAASGISTGNALVLLSN